MNNEMNEKIQELLKNEDYVKHILSLGSAEEMSKELEKEDVELSPEDLRKIYELLKKKEAGELSDEELEEVAGGSLGLLIFSIIVGVGSIAGIAVLSSSCK